MISRYLFASLSDMAPERREIPDWARRERLRDLEWIRENLHVFWPIAKEAFEETGRGAIVVDTTSRPTGEGNPFGYFPQKILEGEEEKDIQRIVDEYDPENEFVVMLIKPDEKTSTYRIKPLEPRQR